MIPFTIASAGPLGAPGYRAPASADRREAMHGLAGLAGGNGTRPGAERRLRVTPNPESTEGMTLQQRNGR